MDNIDSTKVAVCAYDEEGNLLTTNVFKDPPVLAAGDSLHMTWIINERGELVTVNVPTVEF